MRRAWQPEGTRSSDLDIPPSETPHLELPEVTWKDRLKGADSTAVQGGMGRLSKPSITADTTPSLLTGQCGLGMLGFTEKIDFPLLGGAKWAQMRKHH